MWQKEDTNPSYCIWGFPKMGEPNSWMVDFMENPIEMDDNWWYPHSRKPPSNQHGYPLVICYIAIENCPFIVDLPMKVVIFHSYVSLLEGNQYG